MTLGLHILGGNNLTRNKLKEKCYWALEPLQLLFILPGTLSSQIPTLLTPSLFCFVIVCFHLLEYKLHQGKDL